MEKAIALYSQDPTLSEMIESVRQQEEHANQRLEFLKKQAETIRKELEDKTGPVFKAIESHLLAKGLLPSDFNPKKHHLHLNDEMGVVVLCDGESHNNHPLLAFLKTLK
jgi:hypothetical protein